MQQLLCGSGFARFTSREAARLIRQLHRKAPGQRRRVVRRHVHRRTTHAYQPWLVTPQLHRAGIAAAMPWGEERADQKRSIAVRTGRRRRFAGGLQGRAGSTSGVVPQPACSSGRERAGDRWSSRSACVGVVGRRTSPGMSTLLKCVKQSAAGCAAEWPIKAWNTRTYVRD